MMIPIEHIKAFSECPRYYHFLQTEEGPPIPFRHALLESIIKEATLQAMETGFRMDWKRVVTLVDAEVFADVKVDQPGTYDHARLLAEHILTGVRTWYYDLYLRSNLETFVDVPLKKIIAKHTVHGSAPLIQIGGEVPVITMVFDLGISNHQLYNDLLVRGLAWLVQQELGCEAVKCQGLGIGIKGGLDMTEIYISKEDHLRTEQIIHQIVGMIVTGIDYPSVTNQCQSCMNNLRCKL